jgi:hypothetical protein
MAWGGGGPAEEVLWAGRGGKAARKRRRPRVAVASGSAGAGGGGDGEGGGGVLVAGVLSFPFLSDGVTFLLSGGQILLLSLCSDKKSTRGLSEIRPCPRVTVRCRAAFDPSHFVVKIG